MGAAALPLAIGSTAAGGIMSANAQKAGGVASQAYYSYLAHTATTNSKLALASADANRSEIGAQEADQQRKLTNNIAQTIGAQKARMAAGGVGLSSRSAQDIISDTLNKGNLDEAALRYNADMRAKSVTIGAETAAFNNNAQAGGDLIAGNNARAAGNLGALSTILGTGGSVANSYYMSKVWNR